MALSTADAEKLSALLDQDLQVDGRLGKVRRYLAGDHDQPYMPKGAKAEYAHLGRRAVTNWTPLVADTFAKNLFVDGYRPAKASDNAAPWAFWQANGLDARQSVAHRGALEYGTSYALILPGTVESGRVPLFRPLSPLRSAAWYRDDDDEFPEIGLRQIGKTIDGTDLLELFDSTSVYTFARPNAEGAESRWILSRTDDHGLGRTPFVRFRDRLDGEATGIIRPLLTLQDRVNEVVFSTLIAMQYASFRQRWATGLAIPTQEVTNDDGTVEERPLEPFQAAIDRLWVSEDAEAKFGDFAQTDMRGHLELYAATVKTLAAIAQVSPTVFTGDLVNISADALAAIQDSTQRKVGEYETLFGEAWESGFRLAALAAGDIDSARDTASEVRWRDTEARSLATTVDALGKISQMLSVPPEELWDRIPGVTDSDVTRWKAARSADPISTLAAEVARQTASSNAAAAGVPVPALAAPAAPASA